MRFHRIRPINMADFYLPPLPEPEAEPKPPERDESGHWLKRDPKTGRYAKGRSKSKRHTKRHKQKMRNQLRRELAEDKTGRTPTRTTCWSATCEDCGRVSLSIFGPIKPNTLRDAKRIYVCARCRGAWPYANL